MSKQLAVNAVSLAVLAMATACGSTFHAAGQRVPNVCPSSQPADECLRARQPLASDAEFSVYLESAYISPTEHANLLQQLVGHDLILDLSRPGGSPVGPEFHWLRTVRGGVQPAGRLPLDSLPFIFQQSAQSGGLAVRLRLYRTSERQLDEVDSAMQPIGNLIGLSTSSLQPILPLVNLVANAAGVGREQPVLDVEFASVTRLSDGADQCDGTQGATLCTGLFAVVLESTAAPRVPELLFWNPQQRALEHGEDHALWTDRTYLVFRVERGLRPTGPLLEHAIAYFDAMQRSRSADDVELEGAALAARLPQAHAVLVGRLSRSYRYAAHRRAQSLGADDLVQVRLALELAMDDLTFSARPLFLVPSTYDTSRDALCGGVQATCRQVRRDMEMFEYPADRAPSYCAFIERECAAPEPADQD